MKDMFTFARLTGAWMPVTILLLIATGATAAPGPQISPEDLRPQRIPGAVKVAGIYHVATGQWTRASVEAANFGPDTIYNNTAISNYFTTVGGLGGMAPGATNFDEGGIPTETNTNHPMANRSTYMVNGFEIGYCDLNGPGTRGWEISFYSNYAPCTLGQVPDATRVLPILPAAGCWIITLDLSGGSEFCLAGDGGDGFDDDPDLDSFGWSFRYAGSQAPGGAAPAGMIFAGDPATTDPNWTTAILPPDGTGTYYGPPTPCSTGATGLITQDRWYIEDPTTPSNSGCMVPSPGYRGDVGCAPLRLPYASFHMQIQAELNPCNPVIPVTPYCFSNPNSTGVNTTIQFEGSLSVAANDVRMSATLPTQTFGFFITSPNQGFIPNSGGSSGNICLGANVGRFLSLVTSSGLDGTIIIDTNLGDWNLASIPDATGSYAAAVGMSSNFQLWHRDVAPGGIATSNFSNGYELVWLP